MSNAICKKCNNLVSWSAYRGSRLRDLKCNKCGGELKKAKNVEGIQLDDKILDIIKEEFPDLYKRIEPEK